MQCFWLETDTGGDRSAGRRRVSPDLGWAGSDVTAKGGGPHAYATGSVCQRCCTRVVSLPTRCLVGHQSTKTPRRPARGPGHRRRGDRLWPSSLPQAAGPASGAVAAGVRALQQPDAVSRLLGPAPASGHDDYGRTCGRGPQVDGRLRSGLSRSPSAKDSHAMNAKQCTGSAARFMRVLLTAVLPLGLGPGAGQG